MDALSEITDGENDTLDFAIDVRDDSRLACQAKIIDGDGEIELVIPEQSRNIV
jgi:ferredoxin